MLSNELARPSLAQLTHGLRVAIVHPWFVEFRGGEKVLFELARALPSADLFFLFAHEDRLPEDIRRRVAGTSFLQKVSPWRFSYRATLPLLPRAVADLDLNGYDVIVSSSSGWAHGATAPGARHLCYMHTPPRYLWGEHPPVAAARLARPAMDGLIRRLRAWDIAAAHHVTRFVANSDTVRRRIRDCYGRDADVVHPPVTIDEPTPGDARPKSPFVLVASELVPYKRVDLAIRAAQATGCELVVVGDGPERRRLEKLAAGSRVTFRGRVSDLELDDLRSEASVFIHAAVEDFGIATVEALAAGLPVVGASVGGTAEIVTPDTGVLARSQTIEAYANALRTAMARLWSAEACRARADAFRPELFRSGLALSLEACLGGRA